MVSLFSSNFFAVAGVRCVVLLTREAITLSPPTVSQVCREAFTAPMCLALGILGPVLSTRVISLMRFSTRYCCRACQLRLELRQSCQGLGVARTSVPCELRRRFGFTPSSLCTRSDWWQRISERDCCRWMRTLLLGLLRTTLLRWRVR